MTKINEKPKKTPSDAEQPDHDELRMPEAEFDRIMSEVLKVRPDESMQGSRKRQERKAQQK